MIQARTLSFWFLSALLLSASYAPTALGDNETAPRRSPGQELRSLITYKWKTKCAIFLAANAFTAIGFYQGVNWVQPKTDAVVMSEHDTNPDDPRFAVTEVRRAYGVVDGVVKDGMGATLPGSENTTAIAGFRGHVLRLDEEGFLTVYRPRPKTWINLGTPALKTVLALENEIIALTTEGEVLQFRDEKGGTLGFNENRAFVGGRPIEFQSLGTGYRDLISQTPNGFFHPETVLAVGENVLVLKTLVPARIFEKDSAERKALEARLGR